MNQTGIVLTTDVLVVGGGMAGCFAALKARGAGAKTLQIDKGFVGSSGQSPFADSFCIFNEDWGACPCWQ